MTAPFPDASWSILDAEGYVVPYSPVGTTFDLEEINAVEDVLTSGATLSCGPQRHAFEQAFAERVGARHALTLTSATSALELATYLLDLQPGDQVIATCQTYQASVHSLLSREDVDVAFCDIDPRTLNIDPVALDAQITDRTRAVYLVHYGGLMADMQAVADVAARHGAVIVEDCAHALGSTLNGRHAGTWNGVGCFSFQSGKNMSTLGEGGMITLPDDAWATTVSRVRSIEPDASFHPDSVTLGPYAAPLDNIERHEKNTWIERCSSLRWGGTNSTLSEVACAVGLVQLRKLDGLNRRREEIARILDEALDDLPGIDIQPALPGYVHAHHLYTAFCRSGTGIDRDRLLRDLVTAGIEIQQRYLPVHLLPEWRFRGHGFGECPTAERVWFQEQVNLPIYPSLLDWQVRYMAEQFRRAVERQAA